MTRQAKELHREIRLYLEFMAIARDEATARGRSGRRSVAPPPAAEPR